ncbi:MAG: hypothetical protein ACKVJR_05015 [Flavobacteriales bacterium]
MEASNIPNYPNANWMSGKWGVRFPVSGGAELDSLVAIGTNPHGNNV